jgi:hypothetical protein
MAQSVEVIKQAILIQLLDARLEPDLCGLKTKKQGRRLPEGK